MQSYWVVILLVGSIDALGRQELDQYDAIAASRCVAKCWATPKKDNDDCLASCLAETHVKAGACPDVATLSVFDAACIDACLDDSQCPSTDKCCSNTCGVTCQPTRGLEAVPGLPPVPANVSVVERRRGRQVLVEWSVAARGADADAEPVVYLLEERHHVGRHFSASRFGGWTQRHRTTARTSALLKHVLRPGRWYQFRVAAVNERGTQGFSEPSHQFTLSIVPKAPRAPEKLKVGALTKMNGSYFGELSWEAPASDLPIQRYKVFWSRQLQGASGPLVSVLVNHQTVSKDVTRFALKHLEPNSMYFLQVQALAMYGRHRLKGEKTAMVLNTTMRMGESSASPDSATKRSVGKVTSLRVQRMFWKDGQLVARVSWTPSPGQKSRYTVTWWPHTCKGDRRDETDAKKVQLAATTDTASFDVYELAFECKYRVTVRQHGVGVGVGGQQHDATLAFATPSCEQLSASSKRQDKPSCAGRKQMPDP